MQKPQKTRHIVQKLITLVVYILLYSGIAYGAVHMMETRPTHSDTCCKDGPFMANPQ